MATKEDSKKAAMSLPMVGMLLMGVTGAVLVALQTEVINVWPQPASVAPYFGWTEGIWWGLFSGGLVGWFVGFVADESHYPDAK